LGQEQACRNTNLGLWFFECEAKLPGYPAVGVLEGVPVAQSLIVFCGPDLPLWPAGFHVHVHGCVNMNIWAGSAHRTAAAHLICQRRCEGAGFLTQVSLIFHARMERVSQKSPRD
jgi:hypothetical protein